MIQFLKHYIALFFTGSAFEKLYSLFFISAVPSLIATAGSLFEFIDPVKNWLIENDVYIKFVCFAIAADHIIGTIVHIWWKHDFSVKKNTVGLIIKLFCVFAVGVLFEGMRYISTDNIVSEYLSIVTRLTVFLYPTFGALKNIAIMTNGKFPPLGWIEKLTRFNNSIDINEFKGKGAVNKNQTEYED